MHCGENPKGAIDAARQSRNENSAAEPQPLPSLECGGKAQRDAALAFTYGHAQSQSGVALRFAAALQRAVPRGQNFVRSLRTISGIAVQVGRIVLNQPQVARGGGLRTNPPYQLPRGLRTILAIA